MNDKWDNEFYQNISFLEFELSHGPNIIINTINGELLLNKLLELYNNIINYINNNDNNIKIIFNNKII